MLLYNVSLVLVIHMCVPKTLLCETFQSSTALHIHDRLTVAYYIFLIKILKNQLIQNGAVALSLSVLCVSVGSVLHTNSVVRDCQSTAVRRQSLCNEICILPTA